ncbi:MAG: SMC-Scp complex subunit ScpB [Nitrospirae bacterium GWC2_46_6]|nr:MAG: SMC-Scp complex subunit ScpB [Nitrospirae bacterium GWC2_46_6]OGW23253.1 MAG: SMC-Scp complex subunit ScpB [Nitrospirae bacterium GWB2_47_37]
MEASQEKHLRKAAVEALLFAAGEPVALSALVKTTEINEADIKRLMAGLISEYKERNSGIIIAEIADGYQMVTNPDFSLFVKKFKNINQTNKLSSPALETLAITAYKQPITKLEIDQLRGVNSDGAVKSLLDKRLIKIVGKKETPGRPFLYGTTKEFLQYFGLKNLSDLPPINDFLKDEAA